MKEDEDVVLHMAEYKIQSPPRKIKMPKGWKFPKPITLIGHLIGSTDTEISVEIDGELKHE